MSEILLTVNNLVKKFFYKKVEILAVNGASFSVKKGETVGVVGESGCGKSTLGRCIVSAHPPTSGSIIYTDSTGNKHDIAAIDKKQFKLLRKEIQMIFQDPYSSLNPRMTVFDCISEPLKANFQLSRDKINQKVIAIADKVGLNTSYLKRYPHAFSGGQRQRIGIARALIMTPRLVVCDESVSALDLSVQAQVINLLKELQKEFNLTYLFISHDLSVVEYISDKILVMYCGKMIEYAKTETLFKKPLHPYTEALLSAIPIADPKHQSTIIPLAGELPNPGHPPSGCLFHPRCKYAKEKCRKAIPFLEQLGEQHFAACHYADNLHL